MGYKLSPSKLNLFVECPRCFWLDMVKKVKRPKSIFPSLPSGMDRVLKEHFDTFMKKGKFPPELQEEHELEGCRLFDDKEKLEVWRNNFRGVMFNDEENDVLLRGAVDNILVRGNKLIVLDYKTRGFPLKEDTHKYYQLQMNLYNFLLRKNNYQTEDYAFLLFYYPKEVTPTGEVVFNTRLIKIVTHPEEGENVYLKAVELLRQDKPPKATESCEYCKWRGQDNL